MSYEVAVWEGPPPLSDAHAASECERLVGVRNHVEPSPSIASFVDVLLAVHPDLDRPGGKESPWSDGPLLAHADGSLIYFGIKPEQVDGALSLIEAAAKDLSLVAFDPQMSQLLPSATSVPRSADFELPSADDLPLHLAAVMGEALKSGRTMAGILEQLGTGFYVQWMTAKGGLVVEVQGDGGLPPEQRFGNEGRDQMLSLGFAAAEPNWRLEWADGHANLDQGSQILSHVLTAIRRLPIGTPMALQTFPV
ncbi:MAG: TY-Chap domain-containing protein [Acidimicrobiales bacterium]